MPQEQRGRTRPLTIIAQDPSVKARDGSILRASVEVTVEELGPGPWGHRVQVIDSDASTGALYEPLTLPRPAHAISTVADDPFSSASDTELLSNPKFHAQNVYAIIMRTLRRFEHALGRRVSWSFRGHQLKVAPHAFADPNAFYSEKDQALLFGYFPSSSVEGGTVFTCLSHDVVAHETTHALLDGLRTRYTDPSSPDQAAFHEGFADVVALLAVFSLRGVVEVGLDEAGGRKGGGTQSTSEAGPSTVERAHLTTDMLLKSVLFGVGEQMGQELSTLRGDSLRRSAMLTPNAEILKQPEFIEPHRRGEVFVAAIMRTFAETWATRLESLGDRKSRRVDRERAAEEGAIIADYMLTMVIRALDYMPPVHMEFGDFLSAVLTADVETRPDDERYQFRQHLRESFKAFGVFPASPVREPEAGLWEPVNATDFLYDRTHFDAMQRDPDEVFRFIWENREQLRLCDAAYSRVLSVRPCLRLNPDGFALRETVVEFIQRLDVAAHELSGFNVFPPLDMPPHTRVSLYGGGTLIFDDYGRLKYAVHNRLLSAERQTRRLAHLWKFGAFEQGASFRRQFSSLHRARATGEISVHERW
ncbi:MAG: hypothetical protein M3Q09_09190 [Gemmatimonadota bacterium]|nr:hypothetical protein [Gemmatimonadota bacterium]